MINENNVFNEDSFHKLITTRLSDVSLRVDSIVNAWNKYIQFLGWDDCARFRILPSDRQFVKILVAHEGNWVTNEMISFFYQNCKYYEDLQKAYGHGLTFVKKEYSETNKRTLFLYNLDFSMDGNHILAVFATGEEFGFEIYGIDKSGDLVLLIEREL